MRYRLNPKNGDKISQLGLGCMRFPRKSGRVDQEKANALVEAAIETGINYFDTAYIYPGSEEALGKALKAVGKRDEVFIASKLPHFMCRKPEDFDKIFNTQLERLQTDRIDYYFIHMLCSEESWEFLRSLGIEEWIERKRSEGSVRNAGFSFHGGRDAFLRLLEVFDWDFCMVQYNYFDEHAQAGKYGVKAANKMGLPVFIMEPLRGGLLVNGLSTAARRAFRIADDERSPAEWALQWLFDQQEVTMVLSGMSDTAQLSENSAIAGKAGPDMLSRGELAVYKDVVEILHGTVKIPCTGCGYCMPCPAGVDIPACFSCYNGSYAFGLFSGMSQYVQVTGFTTHVRHDASQCISCGKCEEHCPQGIRIPEELTKVKKRMKTFFIKPVMGAARKIIKVK